MRAAAQSFRANENVDVAKEIQELGVGEALVSTLDEKGAPTPVARTKIRPPNSHVGPILLTERQTLMRANTAGRAYEKAVDRESAHEILGRRAAQLAQAEAKEEEREAREKEAARASRTRSTGSRSGGAAPRRTGGSRTTAVERQTGRVASGVFNTIVRELMRGILGTPRRRR